MGDVTRLLLRWSGGDREAFDQLVPLVYHELKALAARHMRGERPSHTLQTTGLVHEAFVRLVAMDVSWNDRIRMMLEEAAIVSPCPPANLPALEATQVDGAPSKSVTEWQVS